jgi:hypothetical protein
MRFHTTILQGAKTATGIQVPDEVVAALGSGPGRHLRRSLLQQPVLACPPGHRGQDRGDPPASDRQVGGPPEAGPRPLKAGYAGRRGRCRPALPPRDIPSLPPAATQAA